MTSNFTFEMNFKDGTPTIVLSDGTETQEVAVERMPSNWQRFFVNNPNPLDSPYAYDVLHKAFLWAKTSDVETPFVPIVYKDMLFTQGLPQNLKKDQIVYDSWICQIVRNQINGYEAKAFDWIDLIAKASEYCENEPQSFNNLWRKLRVVKGELLFSSAFRVEENVGYACGQLTLGSLLQPSAVAPINMPLSELDPSALRSTDSGIVLHDTSLLRNTTAQVEQARQRIQALYRRTSRPLVPSNMQVVPLDTMPQHTLELEERNANIPLYNLLFAA